MDDITQTTDAERAMKPAVLNGLKSKCPRCGTGALFQSYLKVQPECPECGLDLSLQRADDGPAYITILVVAHIVGIGLHIVYSNFDPKPLVVAVLLSVFAAGLALAMLPRMKGMMIAIQWAKRMHGF